MELIDLNEYENKAKRNVLPLTPQKGKGKLSTHDKKLFMLI
jgi:hypothetical protein